MKENSEFRSKLRSRISVNIVANSIGTIWSCFSAYIFLPWYLLLLGEERFGLIAVSASIQALISLLDAGFSSSIRRVLSSCDRSENSQKNSVACIVNVEAIYLVVFSFIVLFSILAGDWVASTWLRSEHVPKSEVRTAIFLMVVNSVLQMQSSLYNGSLQSLNRQVLSNVLLVAFGIFKNGVLILWVYFFPTLQAFLMWQVIVSVFFVLIQRLLVLREFDVQTRRQYKIPDFEVLDRLWKVSSLFLGVSIVSCAFMQTDKFFVSILLPIQNLGHYSTAQALGQIVVSISSAIASALTPPLIRAYFEGDMLTVSKLFHRYAKLSTILSTCMGVTILMNCDRIILIWTGKLEFTQVAASVAPFLILSGLFMAVQVVPFTIAVASADLKPVIMVVSLVLAVSLPFYYLLGHYKGLFGIAMTSFMMTVAATLGLVYVFLRKSLPGQFKVWLSMDLLVPGAAAGTIAYFMNTIRPQFSVSRIELLSLGATFGFSLSILLLIFYRGLLWETLRGYF